MRIDVWSDFGCPFCVIGKTKLEHALDKFANRDQIEVVYRSFQLDPHAENRTLSLQQLALEKSMTVEQLKAKQAQVAEMIKNETGLIANYDPIVISNSSLLAFVFNNEYLILGAQSEEVFLNTLNAIWEKESKPLTSEVENQSEGDHSCTDGSCSV